VGGEDEAAADGVEDVGGEGVVGGVEDGEAHAVGVGWVVDVGVHLVAVEEEVVGLGEGDDVRAHEVKAMVGADGGEL